MNLMDKNSTDDDKETDTIDCYIENDSLDSSTNTPLMMNGNTFRVKRKAALHC